MICAVIEEYGGGQYELPPLLEWNVLLTGSVPCDSYSVSCPCGADAAAHLDRAYRVTLRRGNELLLRGVVDECGIVQDTAGRKLELSGRGLAALLLDNESTAVEYSAPTLTEIVRNHAAPYGIQCAPFSELRGSGAYAVASGASQWKAISAFTHRCGGFTPRFSPDGLLQLTPQSAGAAQWSIGEKTPVFALRWRDRRYGVYSQVLVIDKARQAAQSVTNEAFRARGGSCRRVLYTPGRSVGSAMRYTGEERIRESERGARTLTVDLPASFFIPPASVIRMERGDIGITGDFYVEESRLRGSASGSRVSLTMRRTK